MDTAETNLALTLVIEEAPRGDRAAMTELMTLVRGAGIAVVQTPGVRTSTTTCRIR